MSTSRPRHAAPSRTSRLAGRVALGVVGAPAAMLAVAGPAAALELPSAEGHRLSLDLEGTTFAVSGAMAAPALPEAPEGLPELPGADVLPGAGELMSLPGASELTSLPGAGELPSLPGAGDLPSLPGADRLPALPGAADLPAPGPAAPEGLADLLASAALPAAEDEDAGSTEDAGDEEAPDSEVAEDAVPLPPLPLDVDIDWRAGSEGSSSDLPSAEDLFDAADLVDGLL